jgi:hydroxypyruvate isomerase
MTGTKESREGRGARIDGRYAANISTLFREAPLLERPARARDAGFDRIEAWWPFDSYDPTQREVDAWLRAIDDAGVELIAMNAYAGDMAGGERGVACLPGRRGELETSLSALVRVAQATGCSMFNCLYGQLQPGVDIDEQQAAAVSALASVAGAADDVDGMVLIEALANGLNGAYPLSDDADVMALIDGPLRDEGVENAAFLFDTFHLASNGVDLQGCVRRWGTRIAHVQLADAPGRHEPGTGEIDFDAVLAELAAVGYAGWLGCEYLPEADTDVGLKWMDQTTGRTA